MKLIFIFLGLLPARMALASEAPQQTHALMTPQEQDIHEKAKKRLYPGGRDEEPLKVQNQLPQITRKMGPATEAPVESEQDHATD